MGIIITGSEIIEYNFDSLYIIAKSLDQNKEKYWVINKELPLDSIHSMTKDEYEKELRKKNIELKLKKRK